MADLTTSKYTRTYTSFGGVDIVATFDEVPIGELQGISYSVTREKAPLYTMGSADPRSFSRGKRGIAGSLMFIMFDRHAMHQIISKSAYVAHEDENSNVAGSALPVHEEPQITYARTRTPQYSDQIPPFDITLTGANELGQFVTMSIFGVEILNEGSGISIDDIVNEQQMTFVARELTPWTPFNSSGIDINDVGGEWQMSGPGGAVIPPVG